ncbi:MAG: DUF72 domain-containing protein [Bacteroidetes bacterium]|nr:DUF72 domain-containing protein [Bacteroidota bacterium]
MKFGQVSELELANLKFKLPADAPATAHLLGKSGKTTKPDIYIGCPVYADRGFVGKIYPRGTRSQDYLKVYCQQFNALELNSTLYTFPSQDSVKKWLEAATPGFKFCPKFPNRISHSKNLLDRIELAHAFYDAIKVLGKHLGLTFLQLPPNFSPKKVEMMIRFIQELPKDFKIAVELRHPEWFEDNMKNEVLDIFEKLGVTSIITDVPGRRDVLHQRLTTSTAFIRFTGANLHPTDYSRVDEWINKLMLWFDLGLETVYFFHHEPDDKSLSSTIAAYMIEKLNEKTDFNVKIPSLLETKQ